MMKTRNWILISSFILLTFSSCLKDENIENKIYGMEGAGEIKLVEFHSSQQVIALDFSTKDTTFSVLTARVNTAQPAAENINITFVADPQLITDYNTANGTNYAAPPASMVSGLTTTITIPKGAREGSMKITTKPSNIATGSYALGFRMTAAPTGYTISGNYKTFLALLVVKNAYEADYDVTGYLFHPSAPRAIHEEKYLYTINATRCEAGLGDLYTANYYFRFDVAPDNKLINWEAVGATPAAPQSGFMTEDNPGGANYSTAAPDAPGKAPWLSSAYNNTYNPTTHTFWMHYGYAVGGNGQNTWTRQTYEKWVRH